MVCQNYSKEGYLPSEKSLSSVGRDYVSNVSANRRRIYVSPVENARDYEAGDRAYKAARKSFENSFSEYSSGGGGGGSSGGGGGIRPASGPTLRI